jgi:hypothetical protein
MSTAVMTERIAETSPRFEASGLRPQTAGVIYLLTVLTTAFAEIFVGGKLNVAGGLVVVLAMIAVTLLFYDILSPLNRRLLLVAASFNLVGLAFEVLRMQPRGANIAVVFDGFFCILVGCLAFRSSFLPRILGALMALGGLGWLTLVSPMLVNYLAPYNLAFSLLGEGAVCLWVLLTRANVGRGASALRKPTSNGAEAAGQYLIR